MKGINEYCKVSDHVMQVMMSSWCYVIHQALIRLPANISEDRSVLEFFEITGDDINPVKLVNSFPNSNIL